MSSEAYTEHCEEMDSLTFNSRVKEFILNLRKHRKLIEKRYDRSKHVIDPINVELSVDNSCHLSYSVFFTESDDLSSETQTGTSIYEDVSCTRTGTSSSSNGESTELSTIEPAKRKRGRKPRDKVLNVGSVLLTTNCVIKRESGHKARELKCNLCFINFSSTSNLSRHIRGIHTKTKPHVCEWCRKKFFRRSDHKEHLNTVHSTIKDQQCHKCGKYYKTHKQLYRHNRRAHLNLKN